MPIEFLGDDASDSSPETVLERTYEMGAATALRQESVTYRRGIYLSLPRSKAVEKRRTAGTSGRPRGTTTRR